MQRCTIAELERVAKEYNADIITVQETAIENSQVIETKDYIFWTASDKTANEKKDNDMQTKGSDQKGGKNMKGRGKGKRPRDANENKFEWWGVLIGIKKDKKKRSKTRYTT